MNATLNFRIPCLASAVLFIAAFVITTFSSIPVLAESSCLDAAEFDQRQIRRCLGLETRYLFRGQALSVDNPSLDLEVGWNNTLGSEFMIGARGVRGSGEADTLLKALVAQSFLMSGIQFSLGGYYVAWRHSDYEDLQELQVQIRRNEWRLLYGANLNPAGGHFYALEFPLWKRKKMALFAKAQIASLILPSEESESIVGAEEDAEEGAEEGEAEAEADTSSVANESLDDTLQSIELYLQWSMAKQLKFNTHYFHHINKDAVDAPSWSLGIEWVWYKDLSIHAQKTTV